MSRPSGSSTLETGAVRTYHGRTVEDLIPKIQDDLGSDAIIVHRREGLTGGVAGFFQRPYVEIDAIPGGPRIDLYDEEPLPPVLPPAAPPSRTPQPPASLGQPASTPPQPARTPFYEREPLQGGGAGRYVTGHLAELAQSSRRESDPSLRATNYRRGPERKPKRPIRSRESLERATSEGSPAPTPQPMSPPRNPTPPTRARARVNVQSRLVSLGTSPSFAEETIEAALAHVVALAPRTPLGKAVGQALVQRIPVAPPLPDPRRSDRAGRPGRRGQDQLLRGIARRLSRQLNLAGELRHDRARPRQRRVAVAAEPPVA